MSLFFITGISGSGKSEVMEELKSRGYEAYGVDEDGIAHWHNNQTGFVYPKSSVKKEHRTPEFIQSHSWKMSRKIVKDLASKAKNKPIFLCGVAANENEVWGLFSDVFALAVDEDTLKRRIATRTDNDYGKSPHELEQILEWQNNTNEAYKKFGHIVIDATQPVEVVVDDILKRAGV